MTQGRKKRRICWMKCSISLFCAAPFAVGYKHQPCTRADRAQFQFEDCYIPPLSKILALSSASFLMSHDAATGYIHPGDFSKTGLGWPYAKNQVGSVYQQLNDGARALDLRPKLLRNGTVIFQHGAINIPVSFHQLVADAVKWCGDNDDELVLLLSSNFAYESSSSNRIYDDDDNGDGTIAAAMAAVYDELGVKYLHCNDVYGLTVGDAMELATLRTGGFLLAMDGQDYFGSFCGKSNWVSKQIVTCWAAPMNANNTNALTSSCKTSTEPFDRLLAYTLGSANNPATDDRNTLGPPNNLYDYPFNEIQALWQVSTRSAALGMAHFSSILEDNRQSKVNERMVDVIYEEKFDSVSLFAVDNVALNGNALLSVLRNACGQSGLDVCGRKIERPRISYWHVSPRRAMCILFVAYLLWFIVWAVRKVRPNIHTTLIARLWAPSEENRHSNSKFPLDSTASSWQPNRGLLA